MSVFTEKNSVGNGVPTFVRQASNSNQSPNYIRATTVIYAIGREWSEMKFMAQAINCIRVINFGGPHK